MSAPEIEAIEASNQRQHFTDVRHVTVRWEPYKKDGQRQMKAKGRWQEQVGSGDYWRWQNCDRPAFAHEPDAAHTDADLERAVRAALDAAADVVTRVTVPGQPWVGVVGRLHAAHSIRALDPAAIVASVKRGEGE
jgi:hypothetical protein